MSHPRKSPCYYAFEEWKEIIEGWEKSSLSKSAYCKQKKLTPSTFSQWQKRINSPEPPHFLQYKSYPLEKWKEIIEDWRKSGYSKFAYCMQNNLCPPTFNKWHKKITSSASQASLDVTQNSSPLSLKELFLPLRVTPSEGSFDASLSNQKMEIIFAQGHRLCLEGPFDWQELEVWLTPLLTKQGEE